MLSVSSSLYLNLDQPMDDLDDNAISRHARCLLAAISSDVSIKGIDVDGVLGIHFVLVGCVRHEGSPAGFARHCQASQNA